MGQIERHQRREAVAPVGDVIQRLSVGGFIGVEHLQMRTDGAGIGEWQTDLKSELGCGIIQRVNLQRVVLLGDDDAGIIVGVLFSRRDVAARELAFDAVDGQARQPQAEQPPPVLRRGTHHISIP